MMLALAIACALIAAPPQDESRAPSWITFDVLTPDEANGHRILHLDTLLGSQARAVLLFATTLDECGREGLCAELAPIAKEAKAQGGMVIGVLMESVEELPRARKEIPLTRHPFVIAQDGPGITRHALKLDRPGEMIVINSAGRFVRFSQPSESPRDLQRKLDEVKRSFLQALRRDKEDEQ